MNNILSSPYKLYKADYFGENVNSDALMCPLKESIYDFKKHNIKKLKGNGTHLDRNPQNNVHLNKLDQITEIKIQKIINDKDQDININQSDLLNEKDANKNKEQIETKNDAKKSLKQKPESISKPKQKSEKNIESPKNIATKHKAKKPSSDIQDHNQSLHNESVNASNVEGDEYDFQKSTIRDHNYVLAEKLQKRIDRYSKQNKKAQNQANKDQKKSELKSSRPFASDKIQIQPKKDIQTLRLFDITGNNANVYKGSKIKSSNPGTLEPWKKDGYTNSRRTGSEMFIINQTDRKDQLKKLNEQIKNKAFESIKKEVQQKMIQSEEPSKIDIAKLPGPNHQKSISEIIKESEILSQRNSNPKLPLLNKKSTPSLHNKSNFKNEDDNSYIQ